MAGLEQELGEELLCIVILSLCVTRTGTVRWLGWSRSWRPSGRSSAGGRRSSWSSGTCSRKGSLSFRGSVTVWPRVSYHRPTDPEPGPAILLEADKMPTKNNFFCLLLFEGIFTLVFTYKTLKESHKIEEIKVFLPFLLVDGRIKIRTIIDRSGSTTLRL